MKLLLSHYTPNSCAVGNSSGKAPALGFSQDFCKHSFWTKVHTAAASRHCSGQQLGYLSTTKTTGKLLLPTDPNPSLQTAHPSTSAVGPHRVCATRLSAGARGAFLPEKALVECLGKMETLSLIFFPFFSPKYSELKREKTHTLLSQHLTSLGNRLKISQETCRCFLSPPSKCVPSLLLGICRGKQDLI